MTNAEARFNSSVVTSNQKALERTAQDVHLESTMPMPDDDFLLQMSFDFLVLTLIYGIRFTPQLVPLKSP